MKKQLQLFRSKIIFLQSIPDELYFSLSSNEWYLPNEQIHILRLCLEKKLNHYVMTYKREVFDLSLKPEQHLCGILKGADLDKRQLVILTKFEEIVRAFGVSFVVYKKPLEILDVTKSELYTYYQQKSLV